VISIMQEYLATELSVCSLSSSVNLSPTRLRQLFKSETGRSPMRCLRELRTRRAEQLLQSSFLSIKEIAFQCGARDISHFVRDFKTQHGLTPREFRMRKRRLEAEASSGEAKCE
jgi:transcriptional regulator GlxA family with amidase domain